MSEKYTFDKKPIDPGVVNFIEGFYRPKTTFLRDLRVVADTNKIPVIFKETEMFLETILEIKKPKKILEIGTAIGYSGIFFAETCPDAFITTIEIDEELAEYAEKNILDAGLSKRIEVILNDGEFAIKSLKKSCEERYDFIFIDAAKSHYRRFFDAAFEIANSGGIIVCDNILQHGMTVFYDLENQKKHRTSVRNMREFLHYITSNDNVNTSIFTSGDGLSVSIIK